MGETYTSSGICHDGKSPAFWAMHESKSPESAARSIALCFHAPRKPGVVIHANPSNACIQPKDGFTAARKTNDTPARMHGTPVYFWKNGKVVAEKP